MIEAFGWVGTALVLLGYFFNAQAKYYTAMVTWIVGDILWITYDIVREIYPHLTLCVVVVLINLYGIYNILKSKSRSRAEVARQVHTL